MRRWPAAVIAGMIVLACARASHAQAEPKTAGDLAKKCISDNRSLCVKFIGDTIDALESERHARGEPSCLAGQPSLEQTVKLFARALLAVYAYSGLSASAAVAAIYQENCAMVR
jgi:hypothetical protein